MDRKVNPSVAETVASDSLMGSPVESQTDDISSVTSAAQDDEGRFVPGTLLGGRYRIIGLLGRGGMGEVYRATDLTLGQSVALKFLPEEASRNQRLLERFHGEVRVARLVSHPNVCRVYDIGEVEGMPFISMEYVDGEDLASLLLRIGRLPADKAVETGAQALRRTDRGARSRRDPSRPQAAEHHDQQARRSRDHGFRTGRDLRSALRRRGAQRHARLHGAGAIEGLGRHRQERSSTRWAWCSTNSSPASGPTTPRACSN